MPFNSLHYFLFLPAVWLIFYWSPDRWRWLVLLAASLGFYAAIKAPYLLAVLVGVTLLSWWCGQALAVALEGRRRSLLFWGGLGGNVAILAVLKAVPVLQGEPSLWVSIGVSYFVFQAISYLADINLELIEPERHFGHLLLSLAFFPKLLQGPIERSGELLPQLKQPYVFDYDNMRSGLLLFAWGLFKKVVIADRLALYVNAVYGDVHAYSGLPLLLATYFYALQIYFDFSGYTDMALGTARLFNIRLTQNFNSPYLATSIADFWRRWHISFSRWILDYIFKPLQMQWRNGKDFGTAAALLVTFLACGVWHGISWGFVVWGALHGLYIAGEVFWRPYQKRLHRLLKVENTTMLRVWQSLATFHLVCLAWVFFRAETLADAYFVVTNLFAEVGRIKGLLFKFGSTELAALAGGMTVVLAVRWLQSSGREAREYPTWLRWAGYVALAELLMLLNVDSQRSFIYFQF